jgi:hypothetical protein
LQFVVVDWEKLISEEEGDEPFILLLLDVGDDDCESSVRSEAVENVNADRLFNPE